MVTAVGAITLFGHLVVLLAGLANLDKSIPSLCYNFHPWKMLSTGDRDKWSYETPTEKVVLGTKEVFS